MPIHNVRACARRLPRAQTPVLAFLLEYQCLLSYARVYIYKPCPLPPRLRPSREAPSQPPNSTMNKLCEVASTRPVGQGNFRKGFSVYMSPH